MFYCWEKERGTIALIGLVTHFLKDWKSKTILGFKNRLASKIATNHGLVLLTMEKETTNIDAPVMLFAPGDNENERVKNFFNGKVPLLKIKKESEFVGNLAKVDCMTGHDFGNNIIVSTAILSAKELSELIKEVANELSIALYENKELKDVDKVIRSNRTFE
ncbi:MAG: hypothetical protein DMG09_15290 [Acidobacteria bacterium]|nr:MAG: hypothetical protein DMG09_15290 [Acidobacteriota bacterium]